MKGLASRTAWLLLPMMLALGPGASGLEFRVGLLSTFTTTLQNYGTAFLEGAELAVNEVNVEGGLLVGDTRYRVVLVTADDQDSPEQAVAAAQKLINQDNVSAIIGPPESDCAIPVARLADRSEVPMITQIATNPEVTRDTRWAFRVCFTDDFQGDVLARLARLTLHAQSAGILFNAANTYSRTVASIFAARFTSVGGEAVYSESYTTGTKDFRPLLTKLRDAAPDVLFLPNFPDDLALQLDQVKELKFTSQLLGTDTMSFYDPQEIARSEGAYLSTHYSPNMPFAAAREFADAFQKAFSAQPTPYSALTYDAFGLLFTAAKLAKSVDPKSLGDALRSVRRYAGVTGLMEFDGSPDPKKSAVIVKVENGQYHYVTQIAP